MSQNQLDSQSPGLLDQHCKHGHEFEQLKRLARLSFQEKLAWLEEAHRLVRQIAEARQRRQRSNDGQDGAG
jgi:hypothetical protein